MCVQLKAMPSILVLFFAVFREYSPDKNVGCFCFQSNFIRSNEELHIWPQKVFPSIPPTAVSVRRSCPYYTFACQPPTLQTEVKLGME